MNRREVIAAAGAVTAATLLPDLPAPERVRFVTVDAVRIPFESLRAGDQFKLWEPDGGYVGEYLAHRDAETHGGEPAIIAGRVHG